MNKHSKTIAELGDKPSPASESYHLAVLRSDGAPYSTRRKVSAKQCAKRVLRHRIEDMALAKELGISLEELREMSSMEQSVSNNLEQYKLASKLVAQSWIDHNALLIDTETTGLDWGSEIVEISIIDIRTGEILLNTLVRPVNPITDETIAIHGITNEMVAEAPLFSDIAGKITELLSGRIVVAYNVAFDKKMLCSAASYSGLSAPYVDSDFQCAMLTYAQFKSDWNHACGDVKWHSLVNAANQQGIELAGVAHRALYDCQLTRALILKMAAN